MSESIGIMEGAFFVSRGELIQWINDTYNLNITRIEQLGSGSVYCQILDSISPGKVNMSKVNWKAQLEWEFINNLKLLQQAFLKCGLNKHIEIERLAKAKYQDNLEFAQWMKRYYDLNNGANKEYDAVGKRNSVAPDFAFGEKQIPMRAARLNEERSASIRRRSKDKFKSVGPPVRREGRTKTDSSIKKSGRSSAVSDTKKDAKTLYEYIMTIKALSEAQNHMNDKEKLQKISEVVKDTLKLKIFDKSTKKDLTDFEVNQIIEETGEGY